MASTTFKTIVVRAQEVTRREAKAGATGIKPGNLLTWSGNQLINHGTADGVLPTKLVALESLTPDDAMAASIDIVYPNGDTVYYAVAKQGETLNMFLKAGENAAKGAQLVSDGTGALKVATVSATTLANAIVGVAAQALDNSAGGAAARLLVEIV